MRFYLNINGKWYTLEFDSMDYNEAENLMNVLNALGQLKFALVVDEYGEVLTDFTTKP